MISASGVAQDLGLTDAEAAEQEAYLDRLIDEATATLSRELLDWVGPPKTFTDVLTPDDLGQVTLNQKPTAITSVETRAHPFDPWVLEDAADYTTDAYTLIHRSGFLTGRATVRVIYTAGYELDTAPEELKALVRQAVVWAYGESAVSGTADAEIKSETLGDYSYTRFTPAELSGAVTGWSTTVRAWRRMLI